MDNKKAPGIKHHPGKCGDCSRLTRDFFPGEKVSCEVRGMLPTNPACSNLRPDVVSLIQENPANVEAARQLGDLMELASPKALRTMGLMLMREHRTRKYGYRFMQQVYVLHRGSSTDDYLSNYCSAYILDVTRDEIRLVGRSQNLNFPFVMQREGAVLLTVAEYKAKRQQLIDDGRLRDPEIRKFRDLFAMKRNQVDLDDLLNSEFFEELANRMGPPPELSPDTAKRRRKRTTSIVDVANRVERGELTEQTIDWRSK